MTVYDLYEKLAYLIKDGQGKFDLFIEVYDNLDRYLGASSNISLSKNITDSYTLISKETLEFRKNPGKPKDAFKRTY